MFHVIKNMIKIRAQPVFTANLKILKNFVSIFLMLTKSNNSKAKLKIDNPNTKQQYFNSFFFLSIRENCKLILLLKLNKFKLKSQLNRKFLGFVIAIFLQILPISNLGSHPNTRIFRMSRYLASLQIKTSLILNYFKEFLDFEQFLQSSSRLRP